MGGINRIHHFYLEVAPQLRPYFVLSPYDDMRGRMQTMGIVPTRWQVALTGTAVVGVIDSMLAGALVSVLAHWLLDVPIPACALAGAGSFMVSGLLHARWMLRGWARFGQSARPIFPTPRG